MKPSGKCVRNRGRMYVVEKESVVKVMVEKGFEQAQQGETL